MRTSRSAPRRRDRHGRGLRGPLAPPQVPLSRSRAERFDDLVLDAVERLEKRWEQQLRDVEFAVEDVPPVGGTDTPPLPTASADGPVPLARAFPRTPVEPARVVVYRRPVEVRASGRELAALVHDVVVEQVADLLHVDPASIDPRYRDPDERDDGDLP